MNGVELLKTYKRMCDFYDPECGNCELNALCSHRESCIQVLMNYPENSIAIIEKWSKEHPVRTRQSEFLKTFPNTKLHNGVVQICPKSLGLIKQCLDVDICPECHEKYWLAEVEND